MPAGFGGTPLMELYLMYGAVRRLVEAVSIAVARSSGATLTSLEMAGCSVTVSIIDGEMKRLWDAPVHTAALLLGG
jgi:phosphoenolpyruvate---glycerone phosphotransferase subunit DhaK